MFCINHFAQQSNVHFHHKRFSCGICFDCSKSKMNDNHQHQTSLPSFKCMESCSSTTVTIGFNPIYFNAPFGSGCSTITVVIRSITACTSPWRNRVNVTIYSDIGMRKINFIFYPSVN